MFIYIYIYIYDYICICICIYIYIYIYIPDDTPPLDPGLRGSRQEGGRVHPVSITRCPYTITINNDDNNNTIIIIIIIITAVSFQQFKFVFAA